MGLLPERRPLRWAGVLALLLVGSTTAGAADLTLGGRADTVFDNNVFSSDKDRKDDVSVRANPWMQLRDPDGRLQWKLKYGPSYEYFFQAGSQISGWDQDADGSLKLQLDPKTELRLSDHFQRFRSLNRLNESVVSGGVPSLVLRDTRDKFNRNSAEFNLDHNLSPTQVVSLFGSHFFWNFDNEQRRDRQIFGAGARFLQRLDERTSLGGTISWSRQHFDAVGVADSTESDFIHFAGNLVYSFDPTFQLTLSAGPTLVLLDKPKDAPSQAVVAQFPTENGSLTGRLLDAGSCPTADGSPVLTGACRAIPGTAGLGPLLGAPLVTVPFAGSRPSFGTTDVTFFANLEAIKRWENWVARLSYNRSDDSSAGIGVSSIADVVHGRLAWHPSPRWEFGLSAYWIRRTQAQDVSQTVVGVGPCGSPACTAFGVPQAAQAQSLRTLKLSSDIELITWTAALTGRFRLDKRTTLTSLVRWSREESRGNFRNDRSFNRLVARLGIEYEFRPIHL